MEMIKHLILPVPPLRLQEEIAGVVARVVVKLSRDIESLRGRISAFEPRSPRGRRCAELVEAWKGCLRVCWHNLLTVDGRQ